jgi:RHS repeat-associated protein
MNEGTPMLNQATTEHLLNQRRAGSLSVIFLSAFLAIVTVDTTNAQSYLTQIGHPTFTTSVPVELGSVNVANGDLQLGIPLGSFPQRHGPPLVFGLMYDSRIWNSAAGWQPTNVPGWGGWRMVSNGSIGSVTHNTSIRNCTRIGLHGSLTTYTSFAWTAPDGTRHSFGVTTVNAQNAGDCFDPSLDSPAGSALANDSSGFYMSVTNYTSATVYAPDGTEVYPVHSDTDGNSYSGTTNIVDQLGRTPVTTTSNCNGNSNQTCYAILSSQGQSSTVTVTTESIPVSTNFGQSGFTEYSGNITVVQTITMADGKQYQFTYDSGTTAGHYGELTGITLPTGGQVTYGYTNFSDSGGNHNEWLSSYTAGGGTWSLSPSVSGTCPSGYVGCQQVTMQKPSGDNVVYTFGINNGAWFGQAQYYTGAISSANLAKTVSDSWNLANPCQPSPCSGSQTIQKLSETVAVPVPGGTSLNRTTQYTYDSIWDSNIANVSEWKYYTGNLPASPDRSTAISYQSSSYFASPNVINRPQSITVNAGSTQLAQKKFGYDTRGNMTQTQLWTGASNYLNTNLTYDAYGHVQTVKDPALNTTTYGYTDCFRTDNGANPPTTYTASPATNAYMTTATLPLSGSINYCYYFNTGKVASLADQAGSDNYWHFLDSLDRLTNTYAPVTNGNRGWALYQYTGETQADAYTSITSASPSSSCTSCRHDETLLDGLGRVTTQKLVNDPDGATSVVTQYDSNGRPQNISNPYRSTSDPTYGLSTPTYDGIDRIAKLTEPDGESLQKYYGTAVAGSGLGGVTAQLCSSGTYGLGYPMLAIDESGKKGELWTDGFGKTIEVDQPDLSGNLTHNVCYKHDLLGNLTQVIDGTQTRSYSYDTLSRLTQATTPESAVMSFFYTTSSGLLCAGDSSAVCRRTDARSITTTHSYDALNRLTGKTHSDTTPAANYYYDQTNYNGLIISNGLGRRTGMSDGSGATAWSYDASGHVLIERRTIAGITKTISYAHNLDGSLLSVTYPSSRVVTYNVGNAQRPLSATDSNGGQYAVAASYAPFGAVLSATFGKITGGFGGATQTDAYNNRLERISTQASSTAGTFLNLGFCLGTFTFNSGCSSPSTTNNGSISGVTNGVDGGRSESVTYDPLNRIQSAASQATSGLDCWGQSFTIDGWGNLTGMSPTQCSTGALSVSANGNNQLVSTGFAYDAAGNMTSDGAYTYTYDAENRITSAAGVTYTYDGNGLRVEKSNGTLYWRATTSDAIAETDLSGNAKSEYVFFSGRRIARIDSSANVFYYYTDQLGTTRTITTSSGALCYDAEFTPYGQETSHTNSCPQNYKFTGYERDSETGLDYAFARYYNYRLGRFMSADPLAGDLGTPQSLNRYAYVVNNSLSAIDPLGLKPYLVDPVPTTCPPDCFGTGVSGIVLGNDIFDAISGEPGTYLSQDMYGNVNFGFSLDFYQFVAGMEGLGRSGWTYFLQDLGSDTIASGFLADKIASAEHENWLNANFPGSVDAIRSGINAQVTAMLNGGANPANIFPPKIIAGVILDYAQQYGLDEYWQQAFYNYFVNLGPAYPPH